MDCKNVSKFLIILLLTFAIISLSSAESISEEFDLSEYEGIDSGELSIDVVLIEDSEPNQLQVVYGLEDVQRTSGPESNLENELTTSLYDGDEIVAGDEFEFDRISTGSSLDEEDNINYELAQDTEELQVTVEYGWSLPDGADGDISGGVSVSPVFGNNGQEDDGGEVDPEINFEYFGDSLTLESDEELDYSLVIDEVDESGELSLKMGGEDDLSSGTIHNYNDECSSGDQCELESSIDHSDIALGEVGGEVYLQGRYQPDSQQTVTAETDVLTLELVGFVPPTEQNDAFFSNKDSAIVDGEDRTNLMYRQTEDTLYSHIGEGSIAPGNFRDDYFFEDDHGDLEISLLTAEDGEDTFERITPDSASNYSNNKRVFELSGMPEGKFEKRSISQTEGNEGAHINTPNEVDTEDVTLYVLEFPNVESLLEEHDATDEDLWENLAPEEEGIANQIVDFVLSIVPNSEDESDLDITDPDYYCAGFVDDNEVCEKHAANICDAVENEVGGEGFECPIIFEEEQDEEEVEELEPVNIGDINKYCGDLIDKDPDELTTADLGDCVNNQAPRNGDRCWGEGKSDTELDSEDFDTCGALMESYCGNDQVTPFMGYDEDRNICECEDSDAEGCEINENMVEEDMEGEEDDEEETDEDE